MSDFICTNKFFINSFYVLTQSWFVCVCVHAHEHICTHVLFWGYVWPI